MNWPDHPRSDELWPRNRPRVDPAQIQTIFVTAYVGDKDNLGESVLGWILSAVFVFVAVFPFAFIVVMVILISLAPYLV